MNNLYDKLKDVDWKAFKIGDLFDVGKGKYLPEKDIKDGDTPYITANTIRNGIKKFIGNEPIFTGNVLTVEKINFTSFYQPKPFYCSHDVTVLRHERLNKYNGIFIAYMISRQGEKYSYGKQAQLNVTMRESVFLPVDNEGNPDWAFMENFMKQVEEEVKPKLNFTPHEITDNRELSELEWGEFKIEDIFHIKSGKRLTKKEMKSGNLPFVGSTDSNNGITNFVSNQNNSIDSNVLGVNYNGSVVENFYHPYNCIFSDDVKRLSLKNKNGNKFIYLFLKTIILKQKKKYAYGYKFNGERMKRQVILLPVTEKNEPDWNFMEQYMKRMENILVEKTIL